MVVEDLKGDSVERRPKPVIICPTSRMVLPDPTEKGCGNLRVGIFFTISIHKSTI